MQRDGLKRSGHRPQTLQTDGKRYPVAFGSKDAVEAGKQLFDRIETL